MALKPYVPFDWYNLGEPLTPFLSIKFRGAESFSYVFPNKSNRVYVENAQFSVLDDNGYSTATITLADPDFVNLEIVFLKALFLANSLTIGEGCWFCSAMWGWTYYGKDTDGNSKVSGRHYYMLKNLTYDLTDVELRVTVELMDIGHSAFGTPPADPDKKITVGKLNQQPGVQLLADGKVISETDMQNAAKKYIVQSVPDDLNRQFKADGISATATLGIGGPQTSQGEDVNIEFGVSTPTKEGQAAEPVYENIISGKTYWEAIQIVMLAQGFEAIAATPRPGDPPITPPTDKPEVEEGGKIKIAATAGFQETIEDLKNKIKPVASAAGKPGKHWDILSGGLTDPKRADAKTVIVWGWVPDPPKGNESTAIEDNYRLARTFVYRPASKESIARGETMINSLSYNWTSRGYLGVGLPPVYGITQDKEGKTKVYTSIDDWKNRNPAATNILGKDYGNPSVKPYNLEELQRLKGVEVKFNFDSRTASKEVIEATAASIVVNMWNFFLYELIDIQIETPGDPWIDNTLYLDGKDYRSQDLLVDIYHAYFKVKVYKPGVGAQNLLNEILTGNYLCLKGVVHNIAEGEYTTSLSLMKSF